MPVIQFGALPTFSHVVLSRFARNPLFLHMELNDPKTFNSLTPGMFQSMTSALKWCAKEKTVLAVVVSGKGRGSNLDRHVFCAGMGMSKEVTDSAFNNAGGVTLKQARQGATDNPFHFINAVIDFPKLLVAAVNGHAYGMAVTQLPLFDFVYALPQKEFRTPFSELGVCAEGCSSVTFPAILGPGLASKMLYYAEPQKSETLLPSGFISEIVQGQTSESLPTWVLNHLCDRFGSDCGDVNDPMEWTRLSYQSVLSSKALVMNNERRNYLKKVNAEELEAVARMVASPEFANGLKRFVNRQAAKKQQGSAKL